VESKRLHQEICRQWATLRLRLPASGAVAPPGGALPEVAGGGLALPAGFALELEAGAVPASLASFFVFGAGRAAAGATVTGGAIGVGSGGGVAGGGSVTAVVDATSDAVGSSTGVDRVSATIATTMPTRKNMPPKTPASMSICRFGAAAARGAA
jgi:hypothetical protein